MWVKQAINVYSNAYNLLNHFKEPLGFGLVVSSLMPLWEVQSSYLLGCVNVIMV